MALLKQKKKNKWPNPLTITLTLNPHPNLIENTRKDMENLPNQILRSVKYHHVPKFGH